VAFLRDPESLFERARYDITSLHEPVFQTAAVGFPLRARLGSNRPYSLLVAGRTFYVISDPKDTNAVLRYTKAFQFDGFIDDMLRKLDVSDEGIKLLWTPQDADNKAASYRGDPVLMSSGHDFFRDRLAPGPEMDTLGTRYLHYLELHSDEAILESGELWTEDTWREEEVKDIPFYTWARDFMSTAVTDAIFGPRFIEATPNFIRSLWMFDETIWKLLYRLPQFAARDAHTAKKEVAEAYERYFTAWNKSGPAGESELLPVIRGRYAMLRAGGLNERDIAIMFTSFGLASVHSTLI
jgi:hypothetical protein